ncbi:MAG: 3-deoxy-manno-octulosonate cytidylyltransferase [Rickettsiales bacterium]|nr:3-deoxy-manno-octulosonate cytidylyltransferase [Rickettsiales bacterium]
MSTAILIPARLDSKRLPQKMLCNIGTQPLIAHTIDRAIESNIKDVFLATDSEEIIAATNKKNIQAVLTSKSHQSGSDRIYEALTKIDPDEQLFEYAINLQGDLPFIPSNMIKLLKDKIENSEADILSLVAPIKDLNKVNNPNCVKTAIDFYDKSNNAGRAVYFSRQAIPNNAPIYYEHIGIYAYKRPALKKMITSPQNQLEKQESLEQLRAYSLNLNIEVHLVEEAPIAIDTTEDLQKLLQTV